MPRAAFPEYTGPAQDPAAASKFIMDQFKAKMSARKDQKFYSHHRTTAIERSNARATGNGIVDVDGRIYPGVASFAHVGQHRSKEVQLYRQGEINIVLNAEPYSFAHNYFEAHGPSVCAMALKIDDEASALARACAFGGQPYRGLIGP